MSYGKQVGAHLPCWQCGSSDAAAIYQDAEDKQRFYGICYSNDCFKEFTEEEVKQILETDSFDGLDYSVKEHLPGYDHNKNPGTYRGIANTTFTLYQVDAFHHQLHFRFFTKTEDSEGEKKEVLSAIKSRGKEKRFTWAKTFPEAPREAGFFGQTASFRPSKWVMITEGELDAMSAWQMLYKKMPVVSLKNGAKDTKLNEYQKEFLDKFDTIYLCFDSDEQGKKAARRFSQSFAPDKIRIVSLEDGLKDANDYLREGKIKEFNFAVSIAKPANREGLIFGRDTLRFLHEEPEDLIQYPYEGLNEMLFGASDAGELITILSGSGLGKSTVMKSLGLHFFKTTDLQIGCLFLEENKKKTVKILTGMHMGKNIALPDNFEKTPIEEIDASWNDVFDNDRWVLWDHWGSIDINSVIDTIRYMVSNFGAKIILLDHISIILSGGVHSGDERRAIDEFMTKLRSLVNELEFICIAISHVTKGGDGVPHEEGGRVKLSHARGAGSIYQLSDTVLGLERNGQDDNKILRLITIIRVLKSRLSGETGIATRLVYNKDKGQLKEISLEEIEAAKTIEDQDEALIQLLGD